MWQNNWEQHNFYFFYKLLMICKELEIYMILSQRTKNSQFKHTKTFTTPHNSSSLFFNKDFYSIKDLCFKFLIASQNIPGNDCELWLTKFAANFLISFFFFVLPLPCIWISWDNKIIPIESNTEKKYILYINMYNLINYSSFIPETK